MLTLYDYVSQDTTLKKAGREYKGACPFCGGTDRFWLNEHQGEQFCHCRKCGKSWGLNAYLKATGRAVDNAPVFIPHAADMDAKPAPPEHPYIGRESELFELAHARTVEHPVCEDYLINRRRVDPIEAYRMGWLYTDALRMDDYTKRGHFLVMPEYAVGEGGQLTIPAYEVIDMETGGKWSHGRRTVYMADFLQGGAWGWWHITTLDKMRFDAALPVFIVESKLDACKINYVISRNIGEYGHWYVATCVPAAMVTPERMRALHARRVIHIYDNDDAGRQSAVKMRQAVHPSRLIQLTTEFKDYPQYSAKDIGDVITKSWDAAAYVSGWLWHWFLVAMRRDPYVTTDTPPAPEPWRLVRNTAPQGTPTRQEDAALQQIANDLNAMLSTKEL